MTQARSTKSRSRLDAYEKLATKVNTADTREAAAKAALSIDASMQRLGSSLITLEQACLSTPNGEAVLSDFSYAFTRRDRLGIVGPNGAGKTTLLRALQGALPLDSGALQTGETVVVGHYTQQGLDWPEDSRVLQLVREAVARAPGGGVSADADERAATGLLSRFMFPPPRWHERIGKLSGGERRRLQLLEVLAKQPNILFLDEPTNDLDLASIAVLEEFLLDFDGVLVVVSHDRYFLDKVVEHYFVLAGDGTGSVVDWSGSFSEYLEYRDAKEAAAAAARAPPKAPASGGAEGSKGQQQGGGDGGSGSKATKPLSDFEQRQMAALEDELEARNEELRALQQRIEAFDQARNGYSELAEWTEKVDTLSSSLAATEEKWLALAERA